MHIVLSPPVTSLMNSKGEHSSAATSLPSRALKNSVDDTPYSTAANVKQLNMTSLTGPYGNA